MHTKKIPLICGLIFFFILLIPVAQAITPIWIAKASPSSDLQSIVISSDGSRIAAGGDRIYIVGDNGTVIWSGFAGSAIDMSSDGKYIVAAQGSEVRVFNNAGVSLWARDLVSPIKGVAISSDGSIVATGGADTVRSWSINGTDLGQGKTDIVWNLVIAPADDQIIVTTNAGIRSFKINGLPRWSDSVITPDLVAVAGPGKGFITTGRNRISHYNETGNLTWEYSSPWGNIMALAYSLDGSTVVLGTDGNTVAALDKDGKILWNTKVGFWVESVGVSDDGSIIAAGCMDKNLYIYDHHGRQLGTYMVNDMIETNSVAVSGDGKRVVTIDSSKIYAFDPYNLNPAGTGNATPVLTGTIPVTLPTPGVTMNQNGTPAITPSAQTTIATVTSVQTTPAGTVTLPTTAIATKPTKSGIPIELALVSLGVLAIIRVKRR